MSYTSVSISCPSSAYAGETVQVQATATLLQYSTCGVWTRVIWHAASGAWGTIISETDNLFRNEPETYLGSFQMPSESVTIEAYTLYYSSDGAWYPDDEAEKSISVSGSPVTGQITRYTVDIDGESQPWGSSAPVGHRYRVHAWGKYQADSKKQTRMKLTVYAPNGEIHECSDTDQGVSAPPGVEQEFKLPTQWDSALGWSINSAGIWQAKLEYVVVE